MKMDWREWARAIVVFGVPIILLWLGERAISNINELYDGLCPTQGSGMGILLYDGKPEGYCTGIGGDLEILSILMVAGIIGVFCGLNMWANKKRDINRNRPGVPSGPTKT